MNAENPVKDQDISDKARRQLSGVVVSDSRQKTVAVKVSRRIKHPRFGKTVNKSTKIHAHNEIEGVKNGDVVLIEETRPISKTKAWKVVQIVRATEQTDDDKKVLVEA